MTTHQKLLRAILRALLAADGTAMPDAALDGVAEMVFPQPTLAEVDTAKKHLATEKYISGSKDEFNGLSWTLTIDGKHKAQNLR